MYQNFGNETSPPVDMHMSIMKPLGVQWLIKAYNKIKSNSSITANRFRITKILNVQVTHAAV